MHSARDLLDKKFISFLDSTLLLLRNIMAFLILHLNQEDLTYLNPFQYQDTLLQVG